MHSTYIAIGRRAGAGPSCSPVPYFLLSLSPPLSQFDTSGIYFGAAPTTSTQPHCTFIHMYIVHTCLLQRTYRKLPGQLHRIVNGDNFIIIYHYCASRTIHFVVSSTVRLCNRHTGTCSLFQPDRAATH